MNFWMMSIISGSVPCPGLGFAAERGAVVLLAYFDSIHILCRLYRHGQASCQHEGRYDK